jgi:putative mRNA 3-end processing factor
MPLLEFTEKGIYCPAADVYIDPWRPVDRALITHGHADHARWGHKHYLCTRLARPVIRYRLGPVKIEAVEYGEPVVINGVRFSFHPAGHIIGSAQIRVEHQGEVWVVSGDYKVEDDGLSTPFEPIKCHSFITESTFGLPVYTWRPQEAVFADINEWWRQNKAEGKVTVLTGYALGKAQRLLQGIDPSLGTIYTHGAIENTNEIIRKQGVDLQPTVRITPEIKRTAFPGNLVIATPGAIGTAWMRRFKEVSIGSASGWMSLRGARRRRAVDRGFILSDHADWEGLNEAIRATGAERVFVTHGYTDIFRRWLEEQGLEAHVVQTEYEGELSEMGEE